MSEIHVTTDDSMMEVIIDRPKANAIDAATSRSLGDAFSMFRDDPGLRVAIITGAGDRFFSAGWDLKAAAKGEEYESDYGVGGFGGFPELPGLNKPVIAAVNGLAVGGGFELVLAADLVVASETAEFFFGEVAVGVIPDAGAVRLPKLIPHPIAKELILTGRRLGAAEAADLGLVNRVVESNQLMPETRRLAALICEAAPLAVEAVLATIRAATGLSIEQATETLRAGGIPEYNAMVASEDAKEGPRAFNEKREPKWKGR